MSFPGMTAEDAQKYKNRSACIKIENRVECVKCGYPYSEARYPDGLENPISCNAAQVVIDKYISTLDG